MPKVKLRNMTQSEIYGLILSLKKDITKYKRLYNNEQRKNQMYLLQYNPPKPEKKIIPKPDSEDDFKFQLM
jgi:hypothetical protein